MYDKHTHHMALPNHPQMEPTATAVKLHKSSAMNDAYNDATRDLYALLFPAATSWWVLPVDAPSTTPGAARRWVAACAAAAAGSTLGHWHVVSVQRRHAMYDVSHERHSETLVSGGSLRQEKHRMFAPAIPPTYPPNRLPYLQFFLTQIQKVGTMTLAHCPHIHNIFS